VILAHSFGERYDLPLPLVLFVVGGGLVVLLSFALVLRRPVGEAELPSYDEDLRPAPRPAWGVASVLVLAGLVYAGFAGSQVVEANIVPTAFWLLVWVAVPLVVGLVGDWTRPVNPFAFLARLADSEAARRVLLAREAALPWRLGWWPATALFALLACAELVFNLTATLPRVIATGFVVYALVNLLAGLLFGAAWLQRGEVFSVLFATWGRLGWWRFGQPGQRGFGGGLAALDASAARLVFVLLLLVSVSFDGLLATPRWAELERAQVDGSLLSAFRLVSFAVVAAVTAVVLGAFAWAGARDGGPRGALAGLLPSMVPIAFAYLLAHNLQYLLVNGQLLGPLLSNPTGTHDFGLPFADATPDPTFLPSAVYWYVGLVAIVGAHVLAVVRAHRFLTAPGRSEYPWLVAMVAYTMVSLTLIAQPLVTDEGGSAAQVGPTGSPRPAAGLALEHRLDVAVDAPGEHRHRAGAGRAADADDLLATSLDLRLRRDLAVHARSVT
jgi:hypothetical protein